MTTTELSIAINDYINKCSFAPQTILMTQQQKEGLFNSGKDLLRFTGIEPITKFMGIHIVVDGDESTLDMRDTKKKCECPLYQKVPVFTSRTHCDRCGREI